MFSRACAAIPLVKSRAAHENIDKSQEKSGSTSSLDSYISDGGSSMTPSPTTASPPSAASSSSRPRKRASTHDVHTSRNVQQRFGSTILSARIDKASKDYRPWLHPSNWLKSDVGVGVLVTLALVIILFYFNPPFVQKNTGSDINRRMPCPLTIVGLAVTGGVITTAVSYYGNRRDNAIKRQMLSEAMNIEDNVDLSVKTSKEPTTTTTTATEDKTKSVDNSGVNKADETATVDN